MFGKKKTREIPTWVERMAEVTEDRYRIPCTSIRFGWDAIIGLIPGFGDLAGFLLGLVIVYGARQAGASNVALGRMVGNLMIDWVFGTLPIFGDAFDFYFRANKRNLDLLRDELEKA